MKTELISRVVTTAWATALASIALAVPAEGATAAVSVRGGTHHASDSTALKAHVDTIMKTGTVGVVVQSTGPHGTRNATGGVADQATGDRARLGDRFRIASTTKTFVATVVLQLVAEGRLSLDDTVEHWLPKVVSGNGNDGSKITVSQLLQHTSGLFDYAADFPEFASKAGYQANRYATWTAEQLAAIGMRHAPNFQPGTGWSYSNTNYVLAGMIIKKIAGLDAGPVRHPRPDDGLADPRPPSARLLRLRRGGSGDRRHRAQPFRRGRGGRHDQYDGRSGAASTRRSWAASCCAPRSWRR